MEGLCQFEKISIAWWTELGKQLDGLSEIALSNPVCSRITQDRKAALYARQHAISIWRRWLRLERSNHSVISIER